eukprot:TRINITY_DN4206_c0_g1_i1.p1 TRINITY_DN4206_c0_g1~~TRINITY_DN4206_c0_g1_i1.p1  ORF type:complete len:163 (-),score=17.73 TRINITY_DN4206_c0_g1_i1:56-544(-)
MVGEVLLFFGTAFQNHTGHRTPLGLRAVCIRARPLNDRERTQGEQECWTVTTDSMTSLSAPTGMMHSYDRCFGPESSTQEVYETVAHGVIAAAMEGYNGTVFCYGQTSSGKTHTMYGTDQMPGIVRLSAREVYAIIQSTPDREFLVHASMVEIYNGGRPGSP